MNPWPSDFMFQLSKEEFVSLRSQIVISKGKGGRRYLPYVFTEQGIAMLSSVLRSKRAVQVKKIHPKNHSLRSREGMEKQMADCEAPFLV